MASADLAELRLARPHRGRSRRVRRVERCRHRYRNHPAHGVPRPPHGWPFRAARWTIAAWIDGIDAELAAALRPLRIGNLPIRARIRTLVQFRLDALAGQDEALRRALSIMAMPQNAARSAQRGWHSADAMWRLAGDTAADFNHYTKRATLAALYASTHRRSANDTSEGKGNRISSPGIDGVMRFETQGRCCPHDESFS
jgi:ubiquinone biosynthesis protein COQ9